MEQKRHSHLLLFLMWYKNNKNQNCNVILTILYIIKYDIWNYHDVFILLYASHVVLL